ncbi:MAG: dihydroxy-acid dehydratase [Zymomonas mobilis subsp. pomaceae]|uniref:Dihydroxy-acid dehydratase K01687 dihydroxy-acid dehydratase n=1 Tax=Zymomonas mobilis subsp. pomaceae (strain ATCC 29192 / DSM 22645 / JCM 10191 / CCUG 17912 / NBRC 13757 / NCIMB 11200 / NRRL B-4491 / Barker I) TaxID=579138 RepID=F8ETL5_ZYMMT|nr:dihydroxy-acid dehydratase [Zymomonas mobilis]AEI37025.1 dihydroxy-acid dehydratase; K01687 dihydroxy-acid dehydratase [Zymomonas mobilis subsp. pomaceae ATCC 29192]MDX5948397.1 dihydroxy-acid dehydratase [Zymomonas mobilis subsp. pomaceae]GEB89613.1 hypothetical protein ZMO02_12500 [Zymomonas mobilis subsp. pomaceae]
METTEYGLITLVEEGDIIHIDANKDTIDLDVPENVLAERRKN